MMEEVARPQARNLALLITLHQSIDCQDLDGKLLSDE